MQEEGRPALSGQKSPLSGIAQTNDGMRRFIFPQNVDANHDPTTSHGK